MIRPDSRFLLCTYRTPSMLRFFSAIAIAICLDSGSAFGFPLARHVPPLTGPYSDAKVGDWVSFKSTAADTTTKRTVVRRTAVSITIRYESDGKAPPVDRTIELTGPKPKNDATVEVLDTGKETLTIAGKKYDCEWTKTKITYPGKASLTDLRAPIVILRKKWIPFSRTRCLWRASEGPAGKCRMDRIHSAGEPTSCAWHLRPR